MTRFLIQFLTANWISISSHLTPINGFPRPPLAACLFSLRREAYRNGSHAFTEDRLRQLLHLQLPTCSQGEGGEGGAAERTAVGGDDIEPSSSWILTENVIDFFRLGIAHSTPSISPYLRTLTLTQRRVSLAQLNVHCQGTLKGEKANRIFSGDVPL